MPFKDRRHLHAPPLLELQHFDGAVMIVHALLHPPQTLVGARKRGVQDGQHCHLQLHDLLLWDPLVVERVVPRPHQSLPLQPALYRPPKLLHLDAGLRQEDVCFGVGYLDPPCMPHLDGLLQHDCRLLKAPTLE